MIIKSSIYNQYYIYVQSLDSIYINNPFFKYFYVVNEITNTRTRQISDLETMMFSSRADRLLALPRAAGRHLHLPCATISLVFVFGFAARGSRRAFELPFFSFQPSELGKLLLVLALAGFVIDGARRGSAWQRTARSSCLGLAPAALVFLQPDLGTSLVFGVAHPRRDVLRGRPLDALRGHRRGPGRADRARPRRRPRGRGVRCLKGYQEERLTSFLNPSEDPGDAGYQTEPGHDRHRLR